MTYFLVSWVAWSCIGDIDAFGLQVRPVPVELRATAALVAPPPARKPICRPVPRVAFVPSKADAMRLIREVGPGAEPQLRWCQRLRCWDRRIEWRPDLFVNGKQEP